MAAAKDQEEVTRGRKGHKKVTRKDGLKDQEEAKKNRTQKVVAKGHKEVTKKENLRDQEEAKKNWTPELVAKYQKVAAKDQMPQENDNQGETSMTRRGRKIGALGRWGSRMGGGCDS